VPLLISAELLDPAARGEDIRREDGARDPPARRNTQNIQQHRSTFFSLYLSLYFSTFRLVLLHTTCPLSLSCPSLTEAPTAVAEHQFGARGPARQAANELERGRHREVSRGDLLGVRMCSASPSIAPLGGGGGGGGACTGWG
jgi:hypothetical protein